MLRRRGAATPRALRPAIPEPSLGWEFFIQALGLLSLLNLFLVLFLVRSDAVAQVIVSVETALTIFLAADVLGRLLRAGNRRAYLLRGFGVLDVISCVALLHWLRLAHWPTLRQRVNAVGDLDANAQLLAGRRASTTLLGVLLLTIVVLEFGSVFVLAVEEKAPNANIKTASDALWFLVVSISTVGYGDRYPVTDLGRLIGTVVLLTGIALFSTLTGFLAHFFFGRNEAPDPHERRRERRIRRSSATADPPPEP